MLNFTWTDSWPRNIRDRGNREWLEIDGKIIEVRKCPQGAEQCLVHSLCCCSYHRHCSCSSRMLTMQHQGSHHCLLFSTWDMLCFDYRVIVRLHWLCLMSCAYLINVEISYYTYVSRKRAYTVSPVFTSQFKHLSRKRRDNHQRRHWVNVPRPANIALPGQ